MHTFSVRIPTTLNVKKTLGAISEKCSSFQGTVDRGYFTKSGIDFYYSVLGYEVEISILDKPFFVSNKFIENKVRSLLS